MKTIKNRLMLLLACCLITNFALGQDKEPSMFLVHTDNVHFSMMPQYEEAAKTFKDLCKEHDIDMEWTTFTMDDGRYVHVSALENMAELDKKPIKKLKEAIGKEQLGKLWDKFDECYDSYNQHIVYHLPKYSYNPEGANLDGKNYREFHFMYYKPKDQKAVMGAMKDIKKMFEEKGSKMPYWVYSSGLGSPENYVMVAVGAKDELEMAQMSAENDKTLGDDRKAVFFNMIKNVARYEQAEGEKRPDLSYNQKMATKK